MSFEQNALFSKLKNKKIAVAVASGIVVACAILLYVSSRSTKLDSNVVQSQAETIATVVEHSEDSRTLGYPDARKVVRASNSVLYTAFRAKDSSRKDTYQIFVSRSSDNGHSWKLVNDSDAVSDVTDNFNQRVPSLLYSDKTLYIIWYGADSRAASDKNHQIFFSKSTNGGKSFSKPKNIYFVDGYYGEDAWQEHPIIYKNNGRLIVVWEGRDQNNELQQIKLSSSDDDGLSWQKPINVNTDSKRTFSRPSLVVSGNQLWLFCYSGLDNGGNNLIFSAVSEDNGRSWSSWKPITNDTEDSRHASSTTDLEGQIYLAYRTYKSGHSAIAYKIYNPSTKQWSAQKTVPETNSGQFFPSLGFINGKVFLALSIESEADAKPPKEDLDDKAKSVLLAYNPSAKSFSQQITTLEGGWLSLDRSGSHLEGVLVKPAGSSSYNIEYHQWNTNKL